MRDSIVIEREIGSPIERVFDAFVTPDDLVKWHHAGGGWQTPYAEFDANIGGKIKIAYADPEGNVVFEFGAVVDELDRPNRLAYHLGIESLIKDDDRLVTVDLDETDNGTNVRLEFDIEHLNDKELQRNGWTEHVDNLQAYLEG